MRKIPREIGYEIRNEGLFFGFTIMKTRSGWWMDQRKVYLIVEATKRGKTLKQCWHFAGITKKQWRRFADVHPQFNRIRTRTLEQYRFQGVSLDLGGPRTPQAAPNMTQEKWAKLLSESRTMRTF